MCTCMSVYFNVKSSLFALLDSCMIYRVLRGEERRGIEGLDIEEKRGKRSRGKEHSEEKREEDI